MTPNRWALIGIATNCGMALGFIICGWGWEAAIAGITVAAWNMTLFVGVKRIGFK